MPGLAQLLASMRSDDDDNEATDSRLPEAVADDLRNKAAIYNAPRDFKVGDLIEAIPDLGGIRYPQPGHPAIVVEIVEGRHDRGASGANEHGAPATVRIAVIDSDGDFKTYKVDPGRFRHWTPPATEATAVQ